MKDRPYFNDSIDLIESHFESDRDNIELLEDLAHELQYRKTPRAIELRHRMVKTMQTLKKANAVPQTAKAVDEDKAQWVYAKEKCDKCGSPMLIKDDNRGIYLSCSAYPTCKNIQPIVNQKGIDDPHSETSARGVGAGSQPATAKPNVNKRLLDMIDYLAGLARVNTTTVHTLDSYQSVLWLDDVPREGHHCFARHWGRDENVPDTVWMDILKFADPTLPAVPKACEPWVDAKTIQNIDAVPQLKISIDVPTSETDPATGERIDTFETHHLRDHSLVQDSFNSYFLQKWTPWAALRRRHLAVQKVFGQLFTVFQEQQRLGEQYELVLSVGMLTWRQPGGKPVVRRHVLSAKASLEFDAANGRFTVRAAPDGDQAELELDMLDASTFPANADTLVSASHALRDNFWDRAIADPLLESVANSLEEKGRGRYDKDSSKPSGAVPADVPLVEYAPALILRKRSQKGLLNILATMRRHIENGGEVTRQFLELCEVVDATDHAAERDSADNRTATPPERIYFPLPANEQQRQIILKSNVQRGVLVQGPPGTGKSQTITNLICHLLATGQRVLVTAKTPRALEVLHEKIPTEVAPLCISMLGSGNDERESLEKSVNGILAHVNSRDDAKIARRMQVLENTLGDNRRQKAETENLLLALRERETLIHHVAGNAYSGTAATIASRVRSEEVGFPWFTDVIIEADSFPLSTPEVLRLMTLVAEINYDVEAELTQTFPEIGKDVPEPATLRDCWHRTDVLHATVEAGAKRLISVDGIALTLAGGERLKPVVNALDRLVASTNSVLNRPMTWVAKAVRDILNDLDSPWKELRRLTADRMRVLNALAEKVQGYAVDIPPDVNHRILANDARSLREHLNSGKSLKVLFFIDHPIVKKHCAHLARCRVDGQSCLELEAIIKLIDYLTAEQNIREVWDYWQGKTDHQPGHHFVLEMAHIGEHLEALDHALELYGERDEAIKTIDGINGLSRPHWGELAAVIELAQNCRDVVAKEKLDALETILRHHDVEVASAAAKVNAHPICANLLAAFRARDIDAYVRIADQIRDLGVRFNGVREKRDLLCRLAVKAPLLTAWFNKNRDIPLAIERLRALETAWTWRRAKSWIDHLDAQDGTTLERNVKRIEDATLKAIGDLAALKAWTHCFKRMESRHQQHLEAWQQAMRKLGKGTGKHAHRHRQDAQRHLNECKSAVPAWVMPLHRVYETVEGAPNSFDIIIVDEASQAGFEALPLLYLAPKIIVVGDEKQISPEAVGVDLNLVSNLMRAHLGQFNLRDSFSLDNSLFAHGRIRFGNRITLQEHFRCAPEIIRFSNDLCYTSDPLIPLKQCPPNRLKPLMPVRVTNGYREGSGSSSINLPEAEALVRQIFQCVNDRRYDGMTMGVITLQGDAQAKVIEDLLIKEVGTVEMQDRKLLSGNPYSFQGDERDVIFLSMVAAKGESRIGAMTRETDMRRFNVAASRAREQMWLFHSVTDHELSPDCFRRRLIRHFYDTDERRVAGLDLDTLRRAAYVADRAIERPPAPFDSWFEVDVALDIAGKEYTVVPQFEFAGKRIDLVVQGGSAQFAVECDGDHWHGRDEAEADMARQRMLERCNWAFFRIRESAYRVNPEKALSGLWPMLEERGIYPVGQDPTIAADPESSVVKLDEEECEDDFDELMEAEEYAEEEGGDELFGECDIEGCPKNTQEMLALKPTELKRLIVEVIRAKSGQTCIRSKVATLVLKACHVRTRGLPRRQLQRKVEAQVAVMCRDGELVPYKSKNERLRLGWKSID